MHLNSQLLFSRFALQHFHERMRVLEIGPDLFPSTLQTIKELPNLTWETIDIYQSPSLTFTASSEYQFPCPSDSFDVVVSANVAEHVREVWTWMRELARVCKPGGLVITINPVSFPYHEAPIDCFRIYPEGMKAIYQYANLKVELSTFESLEIPSNRRRLPGLSISKQSASRRMAWKVLGMIGMPMECAFDTITIGRKPISQ